MQSMSFDTGHQSISQPLGCSFYLPAPGACQEDSLVPSNSSKEMTCVVLLVPEDPYILSTPDSLLQCLMLAANC